MTRVAIDMDMASITCHRHIPSAAGYDYDHYGHGSNNHNNSPIHLDLAASTLAAATATAPLYSNVGTEHDPSLAVPSLDIPYSPAPATHKAPTCHSFDLTGGVYLLSTASDSVDTVTPNTNNNTMADPPTTPPSSSDKSQLRTPKRKRTVSPPLTKSPGETRSTSRSTRRSGHSRQSSLHSHRRSNTATSLTPSVPGSPVRRENLLALHRESCKLFQDPDTRQNQYQNQSQLPSPPQTPRLPRTLSEPTSSVVPPILEYQAEPRSSHSSSHQSSEHESEPIHLEVSHSSDPKSQPTIIEWTSPSTRRREYKEIDRASSGVRGLWRKVAPRWCQFGNTRVPFFEEDKDGKANYEGSVRRFRMDLPDPELDEAGQRRGMKIRPKLAVHAIGMGREGRRSKTAWL